MTKEVISVPCRHGGIRIFEGNIEHETEEASFAPGTVDTERSGLNLVVCLRHKDPNDQSSLKEKASKVLQRFHNVPASVKTPAVVTAPPAS